MNDQNERPEVSRAVASAVLWHFRAGGFEPGGFVRSLMETFAQADLTNQARLSQGFPEYGEAMRLARYEPDGIERLLLIFRGR